MTATPESPAVEGGQRAGSVHVFQRQIGNYGVEWSQPTKLFASDPEENDLFGRSVDIYRDTIVVGAVG